MARQWDLSHIIRVAKDCGFSGVELLVERGHAHGVDLEASPAQRREARDRIEDAYLEVACLGTCSRFDYPEQDQRQAVIERTKRYVELAADLGCRRVRVFGNDIPVGVQPDECVRYVGESLRSLGEFSEPFGVDVLLEMHGRFNYYGLARDTVQVAGHPRVGLIYNCDPRDPIAGSVWPVYSQVRRWIRHVHMHEFGGPFPYAELLALLKQDGYEGYCGSEVETEIPTPEQFLAMYAALFRAWAGQPFYAGASKG